MRRLGWMVLLFALSGCDVFLDDFAVKHLIGQMDSSGEHVADIAFSPDGSRMASSDALGTIELWDLDSKQAVKEIALSDPDYMVRDYHRPVLAFASDLLVVQYFGQNDDPAYQPSNKGTIKFYSASDGTPVAVEGLPADRSFDRIAVQSGNLVVAERGPTSNPVYEMVVYQVASGQVSRARGYSVNGVVDDLAAASDGSRLAACIQDRQGVEPYEQFLKVWNSYDGTELFSRNLPAGQDGQALSMLAVAADGSRIAYCPIPSGRVVVWEIAEETKEVVSTSAVESGSCYLAYSPDGEWLAVNTTGTDLYRRNAMTPSVSIPIDHYWTGSVAFSSDSRTLAVGQADKIKLWDVTDIQQ